MLDLRGLSPVTDFFLICSGTSTTHLDTIAEGITLALKVSGIRLLHEEGTAASGWILLDYGDVVMHCFLDEARAYYGLEHLWGDAPVLGWEQDP